ncbi:MAG: sulfotransferase [Phycisphaeraceae bacterium]|nr:MAG: sulfotransferase [Phycisphaeraceae bacterium]
MAKQPRPPQVLLDLGGEAYRAGNYDRAVPLLQEFADRYERHPRFAQVMRMLSASLVYSTRRDDAIGVIDDAIERTGADPELTLIRGHALRLSGRHDEAGPEYEKLFDAPPGIRSQAISALSEVRLRQGRADDARALIERADRDGLTDTRIELARAMLAMADTELRAVSIERLNAEIAGGSIDAELRPGVFAALGDLLDAEGRYDEAFDAYTRSNEAAGGSFDPDASGKRIDELIAAWSVERIRGLQRWGSDSARPVFIVGVPRSGTTLTEQLVARHPDAARGGELRQLRHASLDLRGSLGAEIHERMDTLGPEHLEQVAASYLGALAEIDADAPRITDKMPMNLMQLGLVAAVFPNAHVIHCRRDPRDVAMSCFSRHFMHDHPWTTRLEWLGAFTRQYVRIMDHWRTVYAELDRPPMLEVFYERVVTEPDAWAARLQLFVGLGGRTGSPAPDLPADAPTLRADQVGKGVYSTSRGRHTRYERHIGALISELGDTIGRYQADLDAGAGPAGR